MAAAVVVAITARTSVSRRPSTRRRGRNCPTEKGVIPAPPAVQGPYHTPMFEPYMGRSVSSQACCSRHRTHRSTAAPPSVLFPTDSTRKCQLAVNHCHAGRIHADDRNHARGRCALLSNASARESVGVRGGHPRAAQFAAIPANAPQSGPNADQLRSQLVAHGVDLNLGYLYEGGLSGEPRSQGRGRQSSAVSRFTFDLAVGVRQDNPILHTYLDVMVVFDTQA